MRNFRTNIENIFIISPEKQEVQRLLYGKMDFFYEKVLQREFVCAILE